VTVLRTRKGLPVKQWVGKNENCPGDGCPLAGGEKEGVLKGEGWPDQFRGGRKRPFSSEGGGGDGGEKTRNLYAKGHQRTRRAVREVIHKKERLPPRKKTITIR